MSAVHRDRDVWSPEVTKLLLVTRLGMEHEFIGGKKNKNTLWKKCLDDMKKSSPEVIMTILQARKKFSNLLVTYNRIKKRKEKSGRGPVFWVHYEAFNSVYGVRHNIIPPRGLIFDSSNERCANREQDVAACDGSPPVHISEAESNPPRESRTPTTSSNKRKEKDGEVGKLLEYLKKADEMERIRHNEVMKMEQGKNELEREKINCLKEMIELMKQ